MRNKRPKSMVEYPTGTHYSMLLHSTNTSDSIRIHFHLYGVTSTIDLTTPTHLEYQTLPHIDLTSQDLEWDPHNLEFAAQEAWHFNHFGEFNLPGDHTDSHWDQNQRFLKS